VVIDSDSPQSRIETERLILRPLTVQDLDDLFELHSQPEVARYTTSFTRAQALERLEANQMEWRTRGHGLLAVTERHSGRFLGRCGLKLWPQFDEVEAGWALRVQEWGHGYATEAARAVVDWGFAALRLAYITAMIVPGNARSHRVAQRLGFAPLREDTLLGHRVIVHALHRPASGA
jgi:RimJ/RimL family protein N-acetyltransferase